MAPLRAATYARLSIDRNGGGVAVSRQQEDARRIARDRGWQVTQEFSDNSVSAWKRNRKRPGWDAMLAAIKAGEVDALVCYHGDRMMRQPRDLEDLLDIADHGTPLASVTGTRDLSSPDDRFILRIETAAACRESDGTSRRTRRALEAKAMKGERTGRVPYGWRSEEEAEVVRRIVRDLLAGRSVRAVTRELNGEGIPASRGGKWDNSSVLFVARRPANAALRVHQGAVVGEANWPALVSVEEHEALVRILGAGPQTVGQATRRHLLSGLLACGKCGASMQHVPLREGVRIYRCTAAAHLSIRADDADAYVLDVTQARLSRADAVAVTASDEPSEVDALRQRLAVLDQAAAALAEDFAAGLIPQAAMRAGLKRSAEERATVTAALAEQEARQGARADLPADIRAVPLDLQRSVIDSLMALTVHPNPPGASRKFSAVEDRIQIAWR